MAQAGKAVMSLGSRAIGGAGLLMAIGLVGIVAIMIIPLPANLLDSLLTFNICLALIVLLLTTYIVEPLELSVFPTLLLILTLFRLALNVASTRLILLNGYAGRVIASFGNFVVGGNYVVGLVVFLILVVIQFVVITKGAGRIAEVAARFTLDAMPGKQMSIDADLNAGLIDDDEARKRREDIAREADFYGAMDGASKFVRGDAIAGIIITLVNIIGGLIVGAAQRGLSIGDAARTYTLLTVGDGLVTQIPALIVSTASGVIITRAASDASLGEELTRQILVEPRAIFITAGMLVAFGLVPGLPALPFLTLALLLVLLGRTVRRSKLETRRREEAAVGRDATAPEEIDLDELLQVDTLELEVGYGLIGMVVPEQGGDILNRIGLLRRQCAAELGFVVPPIRIRDNIRLGAEEYRVNLRGITIGKGQVRPSHLLAIDPGTARSEVPGTATEEPAFGLPARWISAGDRERAEVLGYTVVEPSGVIATHLTELIRRHSQEILSRQDVQNLVERVRLNQPAAVQDVVPNLITLGGVHKVLQNLLAERVPIRDLATILEALADHAATNQDPGFLSEAARRALARVICRQHQDQEGRIHALSVAPELEDRLGRAVQRTDQGSALVLPPAQLRALSKEISRAIQSALSAGHQPVLLVGQLVRLPLSKLLRMAFPTIGVLSYGEIVAGLEVRNVGVVRLVDEDREAEREEHARDTVQANA